MSHDRLEEVAAGLRRRAGWRSPLRSEIRYVVAAMILRRDLNAAKVHSQVVATRDRFGEHDIKRRRRSPRHLAALLLALHAEGEARAEVAPVIGSAGVDGEQVRRSSCSWFTDGGTRRRGGGRRRSGRRPSATSTDGRC